MSLLSSPAYFFIRDFWLYVLMKQMPFFKNNLLFCYIFFLTIPHLSNNCYILIQVIGAILVISMLCLPAAIANIFTRSLSKMILPFP